MPSVRAADGTSSAPRPCRRHGAPGGSTRDELGELRRRERVDAEVSIARERAHRVDEPAAGRTARAAAREQRALERRRGRRRRVGCTRQRASGRRRSTPSPVHGASSSTRSKLAVGDRELAAVGDDGRDRRRARSAPRRACTVRTRAGCRSAATTSRRRACARPRRSPCRRARTRRRARAPPAAGRARRRRPGSPGPAASTRPSRTRGERAEVAGVAHEQRVGHERPGSTSMPSARSSAVTASAVVRIGFTRSVTTAARCRARASRSRRRGRARRRTAARSSRGATCGSPIDSTSSPVGQRPRRARTRRARAARRSRSRARASCTTPTVSPTAACGDTPVTSWNAPSRSAARTSGSSESSGRDDTRAEQEVERALHADGAVDELGHERAVARFERVLAQQLGQRGCARTRRRRCGRARRPRRARARRFGRRARRSRGSTARRRAHPRATRPPASARLPSGCTSSSTSTPVRGRERAGRRRSTPGASASARRRSRMRAPHLHPPAADREPRARPRVAGAHDAVELGRGARRVEAELVDGQLLRVGRLARPAARARASAIRGQVLDEQLGADVDEAARAARPRSRRPRSARVRVAYTGPVSSPASSCITHTPVSASPARIARSTGAAPRQRGSSEKCTFTKPSGSASSSATGQQLAERDDDAELARPTRARRRRPRAPSPGVRTGEAELLGRGRCTGDGSVPAPRERRRSGWVTTSAMSWPASHERAQRRDRVGGRAEIDEAHRASASRDPRSQGVQPAARRRHAHPLLAQLAHRFLALRRGRAGRASARRRDDRSRAGTPGRAARRPRSRPRCRRGRGPAP